MKIKQSLAAVIASFAVITAFTLSASIKPIKQDQQQEKIIIYIPTKAPTASPTPQPTPVQNKTDKYYQSYIKGTNLDRVAVSAVYMKFEYIGDYYITAYCPEECGYRVYSDGTDNYPTGWITATGTTCHREEEWYKPSTCGINTSINSYGDLFLIDGKVFVAEDTGPGAVGHWIDTFMPDYESMSSFGSHWTEVYSVEYVTTEAKKGKHYDINYFVHDNNRSVGCPYRNDY